jgi:hypothetical protein
MSATRKITVNVTQEHIRAGTSKCCAACPLAFAICDTLNFPHFTYGQENPPLIGVTTEYVSFYHLNKDGKGITPKISLPDAARKFVLDFDQDREVSPFSFELEVPNA